VGALLKAPARIGLGCVACWGLGGGGGDDGRGHVSRRLRFQIVLVTGLFFTLTVTIKKKGRGNIYVELLD
jgi:hypothetical protein